MKGKLLGLLLAGAAAASVPTGCATTTRGYVYASYDAPPPPREEAVYYRPGYVWIHGHWNRDAYAGWRWEPGYYVRERVGYTYENGHWDRRGRQYVWIRGDWRPRATITVRRERRW